MVGDEDIDLGRSTTLEMRARNSSLKVILAVSISVTFSSMMRYAL